MSTNEERLRSLLSDLGKATLRGVRKCPKCGTYNGSRGLSCKNKYCDAVFKEPGERRKPSTEARKLITGSTAQIFSVRVRDKGPDYRGFVQLPLMGGGGGCGSGSTSNDATTALCFVDSCERSFYTSVLECHERDNDDAGVPTCQHIQAAQRCYAEAQPLTLRNSILSSLNVDNEIKREIWLLATETAGPLVQRVSKNIMAVKCKASPKHPLGYLHFSFFVAKLKDRTEHRYLCSCNTFKVAPTKTIGESQSAIAQRCPHFYACVCAFASDPKLSEEFDYYVNLDRAEDRRDEDEGGGGASFDSNDTEKIMGIDLENFQSANDNDTRLVIFRDDTLDAAAAVARLDIDSMNLDPTILSNGIVECDRGLLVNDDDDDDDDDRNDDGNDDDDAIVCQSRDIDALNERGTIEMMDDRPDMEVKYDISSDGRDDYPLDEANIKVLNGNGNIEILDARTILDANNFKLLQESGIIESCGIKIVDKVDKEQREMVDRRQASSSKRKRDEKLGGSINNLNSIETRRAKVKAAAIAGKKYRNAMENLDESSASLSFVKWLASITERINQTMHYQFDGKPDPLVFHAPQMFFDCLRERISSGGGNGSKKKRLPNSTTAFVRKDGVPLGTFTKYTWQITNILHVKSIFETPLIPLEITRSFLENSDGTYELYKREETEIDRFKKTGNNAFIKPLELKTYLKVGNTSPNQIEPTPFLIEWIPDILPISKIGELRIRFEFGHVKNESPRRWRKLALSKNY